MLKTSRCLVRFRRAARARAAPAIRESGVISGYVLDREQAMQGGQRGLKHGGTSNDQIAAVETAHGDLRQPDWKAFSWRSFES